MGAKEIIEKKFEMVLRGYKTEEVEEFLRQVSLEFLRMQKDNEDLNKKLEVLADKIREYREDEDTLKDALLGAQRQGNALIADSKRKAAEVIEQAQSTSDSILKKAEEDRQKLKEKGEKEIAEAKKEAQSIIDDANNKAAEIARQMNLKTDIQKEILHRTSIEVSEFKQRIVTAYREQINSVEKIAADCENEFIKDTLKEKRPDFNSQDNLRAKNRKNNNNNNKQQKSEQQSQEEENNSVNFEVNLSEEQGKGNADTDSSVEADVAAIFGNKKNKSNTASDTNEIFFKKS